MKGTALQLLDRYMALARDAEKEGTLQEAENFFQHAEHYRIVSSSFKDTTNHEKKALPKEGRKRDEEKRDEPVGPMMILPPKKTGIVDDKG